MKTQLINIFHDKPPSAVKIGLLVFVLIASAPTWADTEEHPLKTKGPIIYDAMTFRGKPDLGLSQELHFIYEWEATLRDEKKMLTKAGSNKKPSARTIESDSFFRTVQRYAGFKYIVIDIESLHTNEDPILVRYVELAKLAAPNSKVAKWNTGPRYVAKPRHRPFDQKTWRAEFDKRKMLVEANDFCILGSYFKSSDTVKTWQARQVPRIAEARRLYGDKPIFVTLAPHYFDKGNPWPFVSGELLGAAMDTLVDQRVDGIVLWSFEGAGQLQYWNKNWDWVRPIQARTGLDGRYKRPAQLQP